MTYQTMNSVGQRVTASGLVAFPAGGRFSTLPLVSYAHGTTASRKDVPSSFGLTGGDGIEGRWTGELFASAGFAVAEPDYAGLGYGTGPIEYMVKKSEVTASADLLTAARALAAEHGIRVSDDALVTGFSQGGAAAMALGRYLGDRGELRALAPVSGPYDLAGAEVPGLFNGQVAGVIAPYYVGYTLTTWNHVYHLYRDPGEVFQRPYAAEMAGLFDGSHSDQQIIAALPSDLAKLLTPRFMAQLKHPHGRLLAALAANSTCGDWVPRVPVHIYAASGDTTVTPVNAQHCAAALKQAGTDVTLVQLGPVDHDTSDFLALPRIVRWFLAIGK